MARPKTILPDTETPDDARAAKLERIKIFERRLQNPNGQSTAPIDLKDPSLVCRWVNSAIAADKVWRAKQQGWQPVRPDDLADLDQVGGFTKSADGFVTRGDRGQEVLMSMPREWRDKIALAKTRENLKNMGDPIATKNEVVQAASDRLGDQAADYLNRKVSIVGGVRDQHEIVQRDSNVLE
jgi:hypothetical protein